MFVTMQLFGLYTAFLIACAYAADEEEKDLAKIDRAVEDAQDYASEMHVAAHETLVAAQDLVGQGWPYVDPETGIRKTLRTIFLFETREDRVLRQINEELEEIEAEIRKHRGQ